MTPEELARILGVNLPPNLAGGQPVTTELQAPPEPEPEVLAAGGQPPAPVGVGRHAFDFFSGTGDYQPHQAAALGGGFGWESGGRDDAVNVGDNRNNPNAPHSAGIGQWNGQRLDDLLSMARGRGVPIPYGNLRDPSFVRAAIAMVPRQMQLEFADAELNTTEAGSGRAIRAATNQDEANRAAIGYWRPQGWSQGNPTAGHGFSGRAGMTQAINMGLDPQAGQQPPAGGGGGNGQQPPSQGGGRWTAFASDPGNRAFLLNMGLALMTGGGWDGPMGDLGRAISAGFQAREATEQGVVTDQRAADEEARQAEMHEANLGLTGARTDRQLAEAGVGGQPRGRRQAQLSPEMLRQQRLMQQFLERFGNRQPTPEEWEQENRPGGLIQAAFGGPQPYDKAPSLLQQAQSRVAQNAPLQGPRGYPSLSPEEMIGLQDSQNPADRLRFQQEMRRIMRSSPGVGNEWFVDPQGNVTTRPMQGVQPRGGGGRGGGGSQFSIAARAGMDAARLSIDRMREYINSSPVEGSLPGRAIQQQFRAHNYGRLLRSMGDDVKAFVHSRSGAQVAVREFEMYMQSLMPEPLDGTPTILEKLARLELGMMMIARRHGEPVPEGDLMHLHNEIRRLTGLPPHSEETFRSMLPQLEEGTARAMGVTRNTGAPRPPPGVTIAPPARPQVAPPPTLDGTTPPAPTPGWGPIQRDP